MMTSSIRASAGSPDRSTAARMATAPSSTAGTDESEPPNLPMGVRAALTMNACPSRPARWLHPAERTPGSRDRGRRVRWTAQPARQRPCQRTCPRPTTDPSQTTRPRPPELVLARRMHALGFLADGVAHDIANPLGAILAFASILAADERIPADLRTDARLLRDEADRTYRMVSALLELARTRPLAARPIALEPVVRSMLELAAYPLAGVDGRGRPAGRPARGPRRPIGGAPVARDGAGRGDRGPGLARRPGAPASVGLDGGR